MTEEVSVARKQIAPSGEKTGRECIHDDFESTTLDNRRRLTVHLPPGYDRAWSRCYPVLYLHDGQNLFDPQRAGSGVSWRVGETADRLIRSERIRPIIIVGIDSAPKRLHEYGPHADPEHKTGGGGADYARFVLQEVKPFIDRQYRTMPGREHTAVAGSSMGGLVSLAMARKHHDLFAMCGALSPSLAWGRGRLLDEFAEEPEWMRRMRFWVCMGTREGGTRSHVSPYIEQTRRLIDVFDKANLVPGRHYLYQEVAGGDHHESAWAARFDKVLLYFFGW